MDYKSFLVTKDDNIASVSFNRPSKANSLEEKDWLEMKQIFQDLDMDKEVRVIILSGEGKHFCAGMDLSTLMAVGQQTTDCPALTRQKIRDFILKIQSCISSIEACRKPVLAAIHNGCIGGGVDIVSACDMRYCTEESYFTIKEVDLGIVADIGTIQRLPTIINPGIMAELTYTGRKVFGKESLKIGLVNQVFEDKESMLKHVRQIAATIAEKSPLVIRGIKESLLFKRDHSVTESLNQIANYNAAMLLSKDLEESMTAFMSKRKPEYEDS